MCKIFWCCFIKNPQPTDVLYVYIPSAEFHGRKIDLRSLTLYASPIGIFIEGRREVRYKRCSDIPSELTF